MTQQPINKKAIFLCLWGVCFVASPVISYALDLTMHGSLKNETAYFISGEERFDKMQSRLELKPEVILSDRWEFRGRVLAWYDAAMDIEATNTTDLTPSIKDHYRKGFESKEAYLLYGGDDFDLRLGQQQIVWGKTDGLRMLDIINPLDMREFILDDFLDSRIGVVAARLNYYAYLDENEHEFELVIIPDATTAKIAPFGSRWGFSLPTMPVGITSVVLEGNQASGLEYGLAWRAKLSGWDVSLNWFYGWKDTPNIEKRLSGATVFVKPVYSHMHTVGGSLSNAFGASVFRAEVAVNFNEGLDTDGLTPLTSIDHKTTLNVALGFDYNVNNWLLSPQVFGRYIQAWDVSMIEDRLSSFVSLLVATDFMNERLKPEVIGLFDSSGSSWMLRPKLSFEYDDDILIAAGVDVLGGKSNSFFGQFANNDRIYGELTYSF